MLTSFARLQILLRWLLPRKSPLGLPIEERRMGEPGIPRMRAAFLRTAEAGHKASSAGMQSVGVQDDTELPGVS